MGSKHVKTARPTEVYLEGIDTPSADALRRTGIRNRKRGSKQIAKVIGELARARDRRVHAVLDSLDPAEREMVAEVLRESRDTGLDAAPLYQDLWQLDYKRKPVSIEQFITDDYYLGFATKTLYPEVKRRLCEVFSPSSKCYELILSGGIGWGKTFMASIGMAYMIYKTTCLHRPQQFFGLAPNTKIVFGMYSITKTQAFGVGYDTIREYFETSPYFNEHAPINKRNRQDTHFPGQNLLLKVGSQEMHAIGENLLAIIIDEANFMRGVSRADKDPNARGQAERLYDSVVNRLKSRFVQKGGFVPGMVFLISSKQGQDAFTERRVKTAKESGAIERGETVVVEYATWETKDPRTFTLPKFYVELGDRMYPSRVLAAQTKREAVAEARDGSEVIEVPGEFKDAFLADTDKAVRDNAGRATYGLTPLIRERHRISQCVTELWAHPFTRETVVLSDQSRTDLSDYFLPAKMFTVSSSNYVPKFDPHMPRTAHVDIGLTNDAAGIAIGHICGLKQENRPRIDGTTYIARVPVISIDLMLRIAPPEKGEIDLSKIREFLLSLTDYGLPIQHVSFDGFQSRGEMQTLRKLGYETSLVSLDRDDIAYMMLRQAVIEKRILYYDYPPFIEEVSALERNLDTGVIDHPATFSNGRKGSKDVSDAVAGVVRVLTEDQDMYTQVVDLPDVQPGRDMIPEAQDPSNVLNKALRVWGKMKG